MPAIFSCAYFPNVAYMAKWISAGKAYIEKHESFVRQTYRSRCKILGANGVITLNIPVKGSRNNIPVTSILIDNSQRWQMRQWRSVTSAYGKAPFFAHFEDRIRPFFFSKREMLFELSVESMSECLHMFDLKKEILFTEKFIHTYEAHYTDFRVSLNSKKLYKWPSYFDPVPYTQVFGNRFIPNLSVLDLIFCEGPHAVSILHASITRS